MSILAKLLSLLPRRRLKQLPFVLVALIVGAFLEVFGISLVYPLMELLTGASDNPLFDYLEKVRIYLGSDSLTQVALIIFSLVYVFKGLYFIALAWMLGKFMHGTKAEISNSLMNDYIHASYEFHLQNNSAQLIRNLTIEATQLLRSAINPAMLIVRQGVMTIAILLYLILVEPIATFWIVGFLGSLSYFFQAFSGRYSKKLGKIRQKSDGLVIQRAQESLGGIKDVKLLGKAELFSDDYRQVNTRSALMSGRQYVVGQLPRIYLETLAILAFCIGLFVLSLGGNISMAETLSTLTVFAMAAIRLLPASTQLLKSINKLKFADPVIKTIEMQRKVARSMVDSLNTKSLLDDGQLFPFIDAVNINSVSYSYPGTTAPVLRDISLSIKRGEVLGIVGRSGAGKSTLSDILLGLVQPDEGSIDVDGKSIYSDLPAWQASIGYVQQNIFLLDADVKKNITFADSENAVDEVRLHNAIAEAQLEGLINELPQGLSTPLGERGVRLSGGQKQRIAIARALYRNVSLLIFDEATSALDKDTEAEIVKAINKLKGIRTIIIIAHRLSTLECCDRIVEIRSGLLSNFDDR